MDEESKIWQEVIFIGMKPREWWLVLSCGHIVTRHRPSMDNVTAFVRAIASNRLTATAPKRAHCIYCEMGNSPSNIDVAIGYVSRVAPIESETADEKSFRMRAALGSEEVQPLIERAATRAQELPDRTVRDPWPESERRISAAIEPDEPDE
jgi:hypothetical protein